MCKPIWSTIVLVMLVMAAMSGAAATAPAAAQTPTVSPALTPGPAAALPAPSAPISTTLRAADGAVMIYVPAGEFLMGSTDSDKDADDDEKPQHSVYLDAYWIDQHEVTDAQYQKCVAAAACQPAHSYWSGSQEPVNLSWAAAVAYSTWVGGRLPTEAEWEKAARGTDGRIYPWGNEWDVSKANTQEANLLRTANVGSYPAGASPYGLLDVAGNVWEWVSDWYGEDYYAHSPARNPPGPTSGSDRVVRGGSWGHSQVEARAAMRGSTYPADDCEKLGFRVVTTSAAPAAAVTTTPQVSSTLAASAKLVKSVLFVGDSDSQWLDTYFPRLAASGNPPIPLESHLIWIGGGRLLDHWLAYPRMMGNAREEIQSSRWSIVVLQDGLGQVSAKEVEDFLEGARKFHGEIKKVGAETVLYMTQAGQDDELATLERMAAAYSKAGAELGAKVAPVALAFQRVQQERPDLDLYIGAHPGEHGLYLILCVLYATIFDRSPVGLSYRMSAANPGPNERFPGLWSSEISDEDAAFLQKVAGDTVTEYKAKQ
jgi:formylglycine-generating enzyme required for sulfatase activity